MNHVFRAIWQREALYRYVSEEKGYLMSEEFVPTVRTTPSFASFLEALHSQWAEFTKEGAAVIYAQFAVETGKGVHCYNHNLGNVKHVKGDGYNYMALKGVWEIINGKRVELPSTHPGAWFRALETLIDGMKDHLQLIRFKKFKSAWPFVETGNPEGFAYELRKMKYYTAPADTYAHLMRIHYDAFMKVAGTIFMEDETLEEPKTKPWVSVYLDDQEYLVSPGYLGPFTIGDAVATAKYFNWQLPTPELVDKIYDQADLKHNFIARSVQNGLLKDWGTSMFSPETIQDHRRRIRDAEQSKPDFELFAGPVKDVVVQDGTIGIYGGYTDANGIVSITQPLGPNGKIQSKHSFEHGDYSQWLRGVILVDRMPIVHPTIDFEPKDHSEET